MGMSTHISGIIVPEDEQFNKYKKIAEMCYDEDIELPTAVQEYFNKYGIDLEDCTDDGFEVYLPQESYREFSQDMEDIIEVDLTKVPKNISKIRFSNSY